MTKVSIYQDNIIILTTCVLHIRASKYMKQKLIELQGIIDKSIIIVWDLKTSLSTTDGTTEYIEKIRPKVQERSEEELN